MLSAITKLRAQGSIPIIETPSVCFCQNRMAPYIEKMRKIAEEQSVLLVDINARWLENPGAEKLLRNDSIHPNAAGHLFWCKILLKSLGLFKEYSALAKASFRDVAFDFSARKEPEAIKKSPASDDFKKYIYNERAIVIVFTGGKTVSPLCLDLSQRNFVSHFNEAVRWETAQNSIIQRSKAIINSAGADSSPALIARNYNELAGKFGADVLIYTPDLSENDNENFSSEIKLLADAALKGGAKFAAVNPPGCSSRVAEALKKACDEAGGIFIDCSKAGVESGDLCTGEAQFSIGRMLSLSLADLPKGSRMI